MVITIIIFLFIIFSSSFSLAKNNEKITIEVVKDILLGKEQLRYLEIWAQVKKLSLGELNTLFATSDFVGYEYGMTKSETFEKRYQTRKHLYTLCGDKSQGFKAAEFCNARIIRRVFHSSQQGKIRKPGDIFHGLAAIERLVFDNPRRRKFIWTHGADKDDDGKMKYTQQTIKWDEQDNYLKKLKRNKNTFPQEALCVKDPMSPSEKEEWKKSKKYSYVYVEDQHLCSSFSKYTLIKLEKFKKDPSNEKVLGKPLIKYIKNVRMVRSIREKIGTGNLALLGDMLNAAVADVKKNNIRPDLKQRRVLLKKYSLILSGIKKKLDEDNYKSIDKDVSKLSKTFKKLKALKPTTHKLDIEIDEAVNTIFDTNKLIEISTLKAKDNKEEKLLALASINFMESLIDSILSVIPEKYYAITKELSPDLFNDEDLAELEVIIDAMVKKNKETKSAKWTKSMNIINKYINTSDVLKTLNNLGMENSISRAFTQETATEIANQQIRDNLDNELFKDVKKIVQNMDKNDLDDLSKEASEIAKEVSNVAKEVSNVAKEVSGASMPWATTKPGNFNVRHLIQASREGRISWGIGRR